MDARTLNRALLARQHLLERTRAPVLDVVEHLVGLQAQAPAPPYYGLWSRIEGFVPDDLARPLLDREVVRIVVMRGTIHLVSARDAFFLRPLVQPVMDRDLRSNTQYAPGIRGLALETLAAAGRELLEAEPRTSKELGAALEERWPDRPGASLAYAVRNLLPLVQIPPRGVWGESGKPVLTTVEAWTRRSPEDSPEAEPSLGDLVLRYLAAFGPATVRDLQAWCGLTRLKAVVERLRPRLWTSRNEDGRELFDLPDAPRPGPDVPAPVRFVAPFDNILLSHADRTRIMSDEVRKRVFAARNGMVPGTVLVDGFAAATWALERTSRRATLRVEPFAPLAKRDREAVLEEADRLLAFAAPEASALDVVFASE